MAPQAMVMKRKGKMKGLPLDAIGKPGQPFKGALSPPPGAEAPPKGRPHQTKDNQCQSRNRCEIDVVRS